MAATLTTPTLVARILPKAEWHRVATREPFRSSGLPTDSTTWRILVVEVDGVIVASSCIFAAAHWDGWQIDPAYQGHAGVIRRMIRRGREVLLSEGIQGIFAQIDDGMAPEYREMLERFGLHRAPGDLYLANVNDLPEA